MSSENSLMRRLAGSAGSGARRVAMELVNDSFARGFDEAASICLGALSMKIDKLMHKMQSGTFLTDQEQFLLSRLTELRSEIEKDLYDLGGTSATAEGEL